MTLLHFIRQKRGFEVKAECLTAFGCSVSPLRTSVSLVVKYGYKNYHIPRPKHCCEDSMRFTVSCVWQRIEAQEM